MRILLLISSLTAGGAETHVCSLAEELSRGGHTVTVASAGGGLAEGLSRHGISHRRIPLARRSPLSLLRAHGQLRRFLRAERIDLIHAHSRIPARLVKGMAKRRGIPVVVTAHARFSCGFFLRRLSYWGDRSIAVSEDLGHYLKECYGVERDRITVIPNGVDISIFSPREKGESDKPRVVFLSRLDDDCSRGAFLLCELAPSLSEAFPKLEILIGGGGNRLGEGRRLAKSVNRCLGREIVRFLGAVENPASLFRSAHVVLGVSRVALEAMACGVPVILGGDEGFLGLAEGENLTRAERTNFCGRGEKSMDAQMLYSALRTVLSASREERERIGMEGREYVCQHHSLKGTVDAIEDVYGQALEEKKRVLLCGYYGFGNMGDDALLRAAIVRARRAFWGAEIVALTRRGRGDEVRFGIRCVRRTDFYAIRRELRSARALIFGGGTLLQQDTSLRSLLYYTSLLRMAQRMGVRTELWGNGLGTRYSPFGERLLYGALRECNGIGLRDGESLRLARSLLENDTVYEDADLAFNTPPACPKRIETLLCQWGLLKREENQKNSLIPYAVVAVRGRERKGYLRILREWLATLAAEGVKLVFVPMFPTEDRPLTHKLCREHEGILAENLCAEELVGVMAKAQVVCSMRLHALIFAASAGTPFVGFGGEDKVERFCRERGGVYFTDLY